MATASRRLGSTARRGTGSCSHGCSPDADRIVYLDADIVVADDVSPLLDVDLGGHALGAVQNLRAPFVSSTDGLTAWDFLGLEPAAPYFNAGVLVLDAARWRAEDLETASIEMAHRLHDADLLPMADQDTLNALFADDWQRLDPRWNQHPLAFEDSGHHHTLLDADALQRLRDDPAIVHFIGRDKPWLASSRHPFRSVWRDHVATAAFGDFRPEAPSTTDRIVGRLRRAGQALRGR
ncbi:MAG: glycosyltransferase family 8 protein [Actinomycetota bacterium]